MLCSCVDIKMQIHLTADLWFRAPTDGCAGWEHDTFGGDIHLQREEGFCRQRTTWTNTPRGTHLPALLPGSALLSSHPPEPGMQQIFTCSYIFHSHKIVSQSHILYWRFYATNSRGGLHCLWSENIKNYPLDLSILLKTLFSFATRVGLVSSVLPSRSTLTFPLVLICFLWTTVARHRKRKQTASSHHRKSLRHQGGTAGVWSLGRGWSGKECQQNKPTWKTIAMA